MEYWNNGKGIEGWTNGTFSGFQQGGRFWGHSTFQYSTVPTFQSLMGGESNGQIDYQQRDLHRM
jgi:hypothetical protein